MPEEEIMYVPFGTTQTPPPASASDFKAASNAAVSSVTPLPTAPNVLTLTRSFSGLGLLLAPVVAVNNVPSLQDWMT